MLALQFREILMPVHNTNPPLLRRIDTIPKFSGRNIPLLANEALYASV